MNPDSTARLARKLLRTPLAEDGWVFIHSASWADAESRLESPVREQAEGFFTSVRELVPTDFSFDLIFTHEGIEVQLSFEDGNAGASCGGSFFTSFKSLRRALRRTDWDSLRRQGIEGGDVFDQLVSEAEDRPVNIPSSEAAANLHAEELAKAMANIRARVPLPEFAVILTRDDAGIGSETTTSREDVFRILGDLMTTQYDILMVLERGVCWSWGEIEAAKLEAVEGLGPISRAKAERRFLV